MKIEVLGTGCAKCNSLEEAVRRAASKLGLDYTLEHVKEIKRFVAYGVMITPALVVDGQVKVSGKVPSAAELESILSSAARPSGPGKCCC
ncbi:MAG: TM0996/MTH895 family glutaredoxin-like protein [Planctomycetes bacterium]|nr:TM0996/MTH895 family glutaredoxin-like protein [Planctomycetota bacterium]